jgi:transcriptional regulator with XRE-family HTH domain
VSIGERVKKLRIRSAMTQVELAKAAGISPNTVWRLETGQHAPQLGTIRKVAQALGVAPHELIEESGSTGGM